MNIHLGGYTGENSEGKPRAGQESVPSLSGNSSSASHGGLVQLSPKQQSLQASDIKIT